MGSKRRGDQNCSCYSNTGTVQTRGTCLRSLVQYLETGVCFVWDLRYAGFFTISLIPVFKYLWPGASIQVPVN